MSFDPAGPIPPQPERRPFAERLEQWFAAEAAAGGNLSFQENLAFWTRQLEPAETDYPGADAARPHRIMVAWRLVRHMAYCVGVLRPEERMSEAWGHLDRSPWDYAFDKISRPVLPGAESKAHWARQIRELLMQGPTLSLLPPPFPGHVHMTPRGPENYHAANPLHDPPLHRYLEALTTIALRLRVTETQAGRWGLKELLDAESVRACFPSRDEIECFEEMFVDAILEYLVKNGDRATREWIQHTYGFGGEEISSLIAMVDEAAVAQGQRTTDQWRTRLLGYLDELRARAIQACDIRTARWAVRDMASVSGVLKAETDDLNRDMLRGVETLDAEQRANKHAGEDDSEELDTGTDG